MWEDAKKAEEDVKKAIETYSFSCSALALIGTRDESDAILIQIEVRESKALLLAAIYKYVAVTSRAAIASVVS